jgi:NAD(P)-dependent dehydrogenase (short-subunit alcohol dehydrogenase family)
MSDAAKPSGRLAGQIILVTGSTNGIGEAMVQRFSSEGATVIIHGTREDAARRIHAAIVSAGGRASWLVAPLEDAAAPERIIAHVMGNWGRLDAIVNNAALTSRANLQTTDAATFDRFIAINLRAPLLLIREALPHFRRQRGGRVLNIGSINAHCGEANLLPYSISKGGLMTMTRSLADAHGTEGLRVNQLNVGWTLTPNEYEIKRQDGLPADWPDRLTPAQAPGGRLFRPDEVARAAVYFLAEESILVNGAVLDLEQFPLIGRNLVKEGDA